MLTIAALMLLEWYKMTKNTYYIGYGPIIILPAVISLIMIRYKFGYITTLMYFLSLWSTDTFAMFGGKAIGGPKLAPILSPNKTWSGLICGALSSMLCCCVVGAVLEDDIFAISLPLYGILNALLAQSGDLFISFFKRRCNVKDTGNLILGHGGVLDRFDGIVISAPVLLAILLLLL